jgi:hypothetical protein
VGAVHKLFIGFKQALDSVSIEILYNILTEFGIPVTIFRLISSV